MPEIKNVAVLGSTGSIGRNALEVLRNLPQFRVVALSGHSNVGLLEEQAGVFRPRTVVVSHSSGNPSERVNRTENGTEWLFGAEHLEKIAADPEVDIVIAAIVGQAGLASALVAAQNGKRIALANKESLVVAGALFMDAARTSGAEILPVDSEHSAIWQAAQSGRRQDIQQIVLTASGGPLRNVRAEDLAKVTVEDALDHPNWDMGHKITIDSATMMNKALEVIEAHWLFGLKPDQIRVLVHPQSIVHSMVEFVDGSVVAQLGSPDMKLPIQYALTYPERLNGPADRMNWAEVQQWDFAPPNPIQSAALELGYEVCRRGGTSGAVLNAANEVAVDAFLNRKITFDRIVPACRDILLKHEITMRPTYEQLMRADAWAREEMNKWICH
jgi:1-deoxy-D-xylulose-5-phosphate reductoisomerase